VCECNVVVAQSLSYPTQLATHRHPAPSAQNSDTCDDDAFYLFLRTLPREHFRPSAPSKQCVSLFYVIDTGSIGSRARHLVTGWGLPIYPSP
jgi:hypothetical protein